MDTPLPSNPLISSPENLEQLWHAISITTLDGFWVNTLDGKLLHVNDTYCAMSGYHREELLQMSISDLEALESSEDVYARNQKIQRQGADRFETQHRTKDGRIIDLDISLRVIPEHEIIVTFLRDITAAKAYQGKMQAALDLHTTLLETANTLIVALDTHGMVSFCNPFTSSTTGYSREELVGADWFELMVPRIRYPQVYSEFERLITGGLPRTFENPILTKDGEERYISWSNNELVENGEIIGTLSFGIDITDRKRVKDELHASQQRFANLVETAQDIVWICDDQGRFTYLNHAIETILGYRQESLLGRTFSEITPPDRHDQDKAAFEEITCQGKELLNYETVRLAHDGRRVAVLVNARPLYNNEARIIGVQGTAKDVSALKQIEQELRAKEAYRRQIIDNSPFGAHFWELQDGDTMIFQGGNPAADQILGIDHAALIGKPILEAFPGLKESTIPQRYLELARNGGSFHEDQFEYKDNEISGAFEFEAFQTVPGRVAAFFTDVTERKRNEQELIRAREEALQANRAKDDFLGVMSHELRTPLTPILGFAEVLALQIDDPELSEHLAHISEAGQRMLRLVETLLDFSRINSKPPELRLKPFFLDSYFKRELQRFATGAGNNRLLLEAPDGSVFQAQPEDLAIVTDPEIVAQILSNLVANACKFTDGGTITIRYGLEIKNKSDGALTFEVEDTGVGIPIEMQRSIWEPFTQGDSSASRSFQGVGLGLAICQRLVAHLGGTIDLESTPGLGSCFRVSLPVTLQPVDQLRKGTLQDQSPPGLNQTPHILVVEDNDMNRLTLETQIRTLKGSAQLAVDGEEALDLIRIHGLAHFSLILLDLHLPGMSGFEFIRILSQRYEKSSLPPVIAISADTSESNRQRCIASGMQGFLEKPVSLKQFQPTLQRWLQP